MWFSKASGFMENASREPTFANSLNYGANFYNSHCIDL